MSKKSVVFAGTAALLIGLGIGASTGQTTAEPQIKTVTKTETVTEEVEVEVVPQGCLDAITVSETIMSDEVPKFADITVGYIDLIQRAAMAGADMDVTEMEAIRAEMDDLTNDTSGIVQRMKPLSRQFKNARYECESAAN